MMKKITAPICDFARRYEKSGTLRLHMPGHKGVPFMGCEGLDITEIKGADSLFEAEGIIAESEKNASALFGARTFYSTEGSSLCIRTMLALIMQNNPERGEKTRVLAGRNAHKAFLSAAALLDLEVEWLYPEGEHSYLACPIAPAALEARLREMAPKPAAVYITSPDYLGNMADVAGLAAVCHAHGVYLLVDNAHGAYLKFLEPSLHPIDLGADLCCDSAHKTLPVLTGGAYLHISEHVSPLFADQAKKIMALFASTSPSYLILQSLDAVNAYLAEHSNRYADFAALLTVHRARLRAAGYVLVGNEPLKWTIYTKAYGYTGVEFSDILRAKGIECEFADPDYVVLMLSPMLSNADLARVVEVLSWIKRRPPIQTIPPAVAVPEQSESIRSAMLAPKEVLPISQCVGRVLADPGVGCPPAVPILVCGERIDRAALDAFAYYGITACTVVKE